MSGIEATQWNWLLFYIKLSNRSKTPYTPFKYLKAYNNDYNDSDTLCNCRGTSNKVARTYQDKNGNNLFCNVLYAPVPYRLTASSETL